MSSIARRTISLLSTLLLTGSALALVTAGCGGGGGGGGSGGSGGSIVKNDAAASLPDTAPVSPDLGKDLPVATTGGAGGGPDVGPGGAGGSVDSGAGGAGGARLDVAPDSPSTGGIDVGGTGGVIGLDAPIGRGGAGGGNVDSGGIDSGPFTCRSPVNAWVYSVPTLGTIAWDTDGSLLSGTTFYPNTTQFGPSPNGTPVAVTGNGSADMLVTKLDPSTGNPKWVFTAGDPQDQKVTGVVASSAGVGVLGTFTGTLEIVTGTPIVNSATNLVDFIAGLKDADGTGVWSKKVNLGTGQLAAIAGQPGKDYFVVCGAATNTAANLGVVGGTAGGGMDVVVAAVKASDGTILWSKLFGGAMDQACAAAALDDEGNAIFAGTYAGTLDLGLGALTPAPAGAQDAILWVAKFNGATGATMSAKSFGSASRVIPSALSTDAQGNVLVTGNFTTTSVAFGTTVLTPLAMSSSTSDAFVAKLDPGLVPLWARRFGDGSVAAGRAVAADSRGTATVAGSFRGTLDVGPGSTVLTSALPTQIETFTMTLDGSTGQTLCARNYGDAAAKVGGANAVAIDRWAAGAQLDGTAIVGTFSIVIDFGAPTTALSSSAAAGYLLRL